MKPPSSSHTYVKFAALGILGKVWLEHLRNYSFLFPSPNTTQQSLPTQAESHFTAVTELSFYIDLRVYIF